MANEEGTVFDRVKLLLDKESEEIKLYWIRTNIFVLLNVGAFGLIASKTDNGNIFDKPFILPMSLAGVLFSFIWLQVNHLSVAHYQKWRKDAADLIKNNLILKGTFKNSLALDLGEKKHKKYGILKRSLYSLEVLILFKEKREMRECPANWIEKHHGLTQWIQFLIWLIFVGWMALFLYGAFITDNCRAYPISAL